MKPVKKIKETEEAEMTSNQDIKPITAEEQAIAARVTSETMDWQTITEEDVEDYSLSKDPFELPPPAMEKQEKKEFFFRWITRSQQRLDEMRSKQAPFRYWICNSTNTPFLKGYFDPVLGCVAREDQMLVFKPYWMHVKERLHKEGLAKALDQAGDITAKHGQSDGGYEWKAGIRSIEGGQIGSEIRGSDVILGDVSEYEKGGGFASSADLTVMD